MMISIWTSLMMNLITLIELKLGRRVERVAAETGSLGRSEE